MKITIHKNKRTKALKIKRNRTLIYVLFISLATMSYLVWNIVIGALSQVGVMEVVRIISV